MKKLSQGKYDEVIDPASLDSKNKISKFHCWLLKLENMATKRNIALFILFMMLFVFQLYPRMKYVVLTFDKHYFGILTERMPILAKTTPHINYYTEHGIPFRTIDERNQKVMEYHQRIANGEMHEWDQEYYD